MKILDLFAGIGGFSLAAHWLGWDTVAFVEKDEFCQKVLRKNFGDIPIYDDIRTFSGKPFRGCVDIITGGFPCQPFSVAGNQKGSSDERHLFPEMLRVIGEVEPPWVVAENVRGLLGIESGETFDEICSSLENLGYAVQTFCIPACAVNAPHRRDRLWIVAHSNGERERTGHRKIQVSNGEISERNDDAESGDTDCNTLAHAESAGRQQHPGKGNGAASENGRKIDDGREAPQTNIALGGDSNASNAANERHRETRGNRQRQAQRSSGDDSTHASDAKSEGLEGRCGNGFGTPETRFGQSYFNEGWRENWLEVATRLCGISHEFSDELDVVGSRDNRVNRLKALGNAVVPALVYEIFEAIEQVEINERL